VQEALEECGLRVYIKGELGAADELVFAASDEKYYQKGVFSLALNLLATRNVGKLNTTGSNWALKMQSRQLLRHKSQDWAVMRETSQESSSWGLESTRSRKQ
jgi:hypothetical protein